MLNWRGFDNDEIYYLSPQSYADFNGDGFKVFVSGNSKAYSRNLKGPNFCKRQTGQGLEHAITQLFLKNYIIIKELENNAGNQDMARRRDGTRG
jgi:hypothetical protein